MGATKLQQKSMKQVNTKESKDRTMTVPFWLSEQGLGQLLGFSEQGLGQLLGLLEIGLKP